MFCHILFSLFVIDFCLPSLKVIKSAGECSALIYYHDNCSFLDSGKGKLFNYDVGDGARPRFCLWKKNDTMLLIIRGSSSVEDWKDNFNMKPVKDEDMGAYFHKGFLNQAKAIWNIVGEEIKNHKGKVYFTGHSRGAAIAEIVHVYGKTVLGKKIGVKSAGDNFETIAFAPPPAMSLEGEVIDSSPKITMFIHGHDIVPHLFIRLFNEEVVNGITSFCSMASLLGVANLPCDGWTESVEDIKRLVADHSADANHALGYVGANKYWLRYNDSSDGVGQMGLNSKRKKALSECKTTLNELKAVSSSIDNLLHPNAFIDHDVEKYVAYLKQIKKLSQYVDSSVDL